MHLRQRLHGNKTKPTHAATRQTRKHLRQERKKEQHLRPRTRRGYVDLLKSGGGRRPTLNVEPLRKFVWLPPPVIPPPLPSLRPPSQSILPHSSAYPPLHISPPLSSLLAPHLITFTISKSHSSALHRPRQHLVPSPPHPLTPRPPHLRGPDASPLSAPLPP